METVGGIGIGALQSAGVAGDFRIAIGVALVSVIALVLWRVWCERAEDARLLRDMLRPSASSQEMEKIVDRMIADAKPGEGQRLIHGLEPSPRRPRNPVRGGRARSRVVVAGHGGF